MHDKFWKNKYTVGNNEVTLELNDIKKVEFNLENSKCYFFIDGTNEGIEVEYDQAVIAISSNNLWRPII